MTATLRPRRLVAPLVNRLVAASIDLAIIALPTVAIALITAERFTVIGPDGAPARFSVVDQARLDEIDGGLHRAIEIGGSLYALDLAGLLATAATMTLAALIAHVAFPVLGGGRSPGKAVTGLRVVADDGGPVGVWQHVIRTVAGPIDLLGLGIPGLLGTLLAWSDVDRRRLGDRLAETRVSGRPTEWVVAGGTGPPASADRSSIAALASTRPPSSNPTEVPVTILLTNADRPDPTRAPTAAAPFRPDPLHSNPRNSGPLQVEPPHSGPLDLDQLCPAPPLRPIRRLDGSPTRSPQSRRGAIRAETEAKAAVAEPTPRAGWLGGNADYAGWVATKGTTAGTGAGRRVGSSPSGPYDTLLFPESSLAEGMSATTITRPDHDRGDDLVVEPDGATKPMWDRNREVWVYRDRDNGRWFRHDEATGHWSPIVTDDGSDGQPVRL